MYYSICYDISNDKTRRKAAKMCKKAGLVRVQKSVFMGHSQDFRVREIKDVLRPLLNAKTDSLSIQPLDKMAFQNLNFIGKTIEKSAVARKQWVIFF